MVDYVVRVLEAEAQGEDVLGQQTHYHALIVPNLVFVLDYLEFAAQVRNAFSRL